MASNCVSRVELSVSCQNLIDLDSFSKSDPQVVLFIKDKNNLNNWLELDRTEIVWDNLNPKFVKKFIIDYFFEEVQYLRFVILDVDNSKSSRVSDQEIIGQHECRLAEIVSSGQCYTKPLQNPTSKLIKSGTISIICEEIHNTLDKVSITVSGRHLDKKDWFGKSDPFLVISRSYENGQFNPVHKTEVINNSLNPRWRSFDLSVQQLCNGDLDRPLLIEVFDWDRWGESDFIGKFETSLNTILNNGDKVEYSLINSTKKAKNKSYVNSGVIVFDKAVLVKQYSFLDYIRGGQEISLVVAIDYTGSNGDPRSPSSLHYQNPQVMNEYQCAIRAVGEIISCYDTDNMFPVYGFGAKVPPNWQVDHCFPCNFNPQNPFVHGVDGILQAYSQCLGQVVLHGPTLFAPIVRSAADVARRAETGSHPYFVLLIITDGEICDLNQTIEEVVAASYLPLSIIIVGVGNADFTAMNQLDADEAPLQANGRRMARDIVQFVPFRNFKNVHYSCLAKEVLAEVPNQLLAYMKSKNVIPNPPRQQQQQQMMQPQGVSLPVNNNAPTTNNDIPFNVQVNAPSLQKY